jgi:predicted anti-sigma-YlaC factor YlaD
MNCYQARGLLSSYLDGEIIDLEVVREIEVHLTKGGACEEDLLALKALIKAVRERTAYYKAPEGLEARIRARTTEVEN